MSELGKRLKQARQAHNYTQAEAAKILGVSRSYVSDSESGRREPSFSMLVQIARVSQFPISFFADAVETDEGIRVRALQLRQSKAREHRGTGISYPPILEE